MGCCNKFALGDHAHSGGYDGCCDGYNDISEGTVLDCFNAHLIRDPHNVERNEQGLPAGEGVVKDRCRVGKLKKA